MQCIDPIIVCWRREMGQDLMEARGSEGRGTRDLSTTEVRVNGHMDEETDRA